MSPTLQFILPTSDLHGGIRLPIEIAQWLEETGWSPRLVGPGPRPEWHEMTVPWLPLNPLDETTIPEADVTIATFYTTVEPALRSGSPHVFHLCQGFEGLHPEYAAIRGVIDKAYRAAIPKLIVSQHLEAILKDHYPDVRCHFVGEAVDPRLFHPGEFRSGPGPLRVGLVGTFPVRVKGIRDGLEGVRLARLAGLDIELHRASVDPMTEEETDLGPTDRFHCHLPTASMPSFYAGIDVLVFPSLSEEGFGLPVLEALACGVPVLHSDIPSLRALPPTATLRFPPGDPAAIARQLDELRDPAVRRSLRAAGLAAAEMFRPQTLVSRMEGALAAEGCPTP